MGVQPMDVDGRVEAAGWKPKNCVWELTLACDLRCHHCGSRAGRAREDELSTAQCLDVVDQLADLGNEVVTLSGGEPTLRDDWDRIAAHAAERGLFTNMVTNGAFTEERAVEISARAAAAGMCNVGVSLDGPEEVHESIRGRGTFKKTLRAIEHFTSAGLRVTALTTVNRRNVPHLAAVRRIAIDSGATVWRLQLAKPMGSMDRHPDLVIEPRELLRLIPALDRMKKQGEIKLRISDSIGYFGPHERSLRSTTWHGRSGTWQGCQAGMRVIGIEADGGVKGCLSMQAELDGDESFVEGNLQNERLADIWNRRGVFTYNRDFHTDQLTGACHGCRHDSKCRGGARCMAAATTGGLTDDPYCYHAVDDRRRLPLLERSAAAAAFAIAVSTAACSSPDAEPRPDPVLVEPGPEPIDTAEYAVEPDPYPEPINVAEYAVEPEPEPVPVPAYGIEPEPYPEPVAVPEYGVEID